MSRPDILSLAKQGNPRAIAALINHSTQPQGITIQVARQDRCLHMLIESAQVPNQQNMVALITSSLQILKVESVATVRLYGRRTGEKSVAWNHIIDLKALSQPLTSPISPSPISPSPISPVTASTPEPAAAPPHPEEAIAIEAPTFEPQPPEPSNPTSVVATEVSIAMPEPSSDIILDDQPTAAPAETIDWLKRPEAVLLLLFVVVFVLWDLYQSLIEATDTRTALTEQELAQRLGTNPDTISRRKERDDFCGWSQAIDPDGIAWLYQNQVFIPRL